VRGSRVYLYFVGWCGRLLTYAQYSQQFLRLPLSWKVLPLRSLIVPLNPKKHVACNQLELLSPNLAE
jgi:hypothetical protein